MTETEIQEVANRFKEGQVIVFPTETVMGVGCIVTHKEAIRRVYALKRRPPNQPTHVLVSDVVMAAKLGYINNPNAQSLIASFWPGPLTLVVPSRDLDAGRLILNEDKEIGLRMPAHKDLLEIIESVGTGILGPSANIAGGEPVNDPSQIDKEIRSRVDYVIEQKSDGQKPSTIVQVSRYNWTIIREGPISSQDIREVLEESKYQ